MAGTTKLFVIAALATGAAASAQPIPEGVYKQGAGPRTICELTAPDIAAIRRLVMGRPTIEKVADDTSADAYADNATKNLWSFTKPANPAHPAAVCRRPIEAPEGISIQLQISCEATRDACDKLYRDYLALNEAAVRSLRKP